MSDDQACENTDRELWRGPDEGNGDYYANSIHVTKDGGIGINVGGLVIVKPLRAWHALAVGQSPADDSPGVTIPTCCVTGAIPGDGGACGDCDPCIMGEAYVPEAVKRLIAEKNSLIHRIGELEDAALTAPDKGGPDESRDALAQECREILDWHATGTLVDGMVRKRASAIEEKLGLMEHQALAVAEKEIADAAMNAALAISVPGPEREALAHALLFKSSEGEDDRPGSAYNPLTTTQRLELAAALRARSVAESDPVLTDEPQTMIATDLLTRARNRINYLTTLGHERHQAASDEIVRLIDKSLSPATPKDTTE